MTNFPYYTTPEGGKSIGETGDFRKMRRGLRMARVDLREENLDFCRIGAYNRDDLNRRGSARRDMALRAARISYDAWRLPL